MDAAEYPVTQEWARKAHIDNERYLEMYAHSIRDPEGFWAEQAKRIDWFRAPTIVKNVDYGPPEVSIRWYEDGVLNVSHNCLDRHLASRGDRTAIVWEGDDPAEDKTITYRELHRDVCKFANALKGLGVGKGDRVTLYLPMIPEAAVAMLACARIGAIHSIVFGGFSPDALAGRIDDCDSEYIVTADEGLRGGRAVPLKVNTDAAIDIAGKIRKTVVVRRTGADIAWHDGRDHWYHELMDGASEDCPAEPMNAEDPLFILYTSGSTGKPKGVMHTTGGYSVYTAMTHELIFDYHDGDVYWCTADVGWVTGHSYIVYGPLQNGAITLMFEGVPNYPDSSRFWQVCDKHGVNIFLHRADRPARPDARRRRPGEGVQPRVAAPARHGRRADQSRGLGMVLPGRRRQPLPDRRHLVADRDRRHPDQPLAGRDPAEARLGDPALLRQSAPRSSTPTARCRDGACAGNLCIADSWPGQMRTVYRDHDRFVQTYFSTYKGKYFTGDGCRRDSDGYYWITGRVDDVINVSGHRMGTAEVESALVAHAKVAEAAVVGAPHEVKGQGIYAYVTLIAGAEPSDDLRKELVRWVRKEIGPIASPDWLQWAPGLPKTRSGKIMRRILRKIAEDDFGNLGDTSTLAEPAVVDDLVDNRQNRTG